METGFADFEDCHGYHAGTLYYSFPYPKRELFYVSLLDFCFKSPYSSSKNCKIMFVWRADGMLKFSLEDNLILVSDHEVTSPRS
jgi:hypothetical protein